MLGLPSARYGVRNVNAYELSGHWAGVRKGLYQALEALSDEQLGFVPREGLWSLGEVVRHIANAEEGWFRYAVTHELEGWPEGYTADEYGTVASLQALLAQVHGHTEAYLSTIDAADVDQVVELPWGPEVTLRWVIWHVLEHEIHHRGEIYLMLGLLGLEAPDV